MAAAVEVPTIIGEYTLSLSADIPTDQLQSWAQYIHDSLSENQTDGGCHWMWNNKERFFWSMRSMSNLVTKGGINWSDIFVESQEVKEFLQ